MANEILKRYAFVFTTENPSDETGLSPTFTVFQALDGTSVAVPASVSELSSTGFYTADVTLLVDTPIAFVLDGATTGLGTDRYLSGIFDPLDGCDSQNYTLLGYAATLNAIGTTNFAIGTTSVGFGATNYALNVTLGAIGETLSAIGTTNAAIGQTLNAIGLTNAAFASTNVAIGTTITGLLGDTSSSFGDFSTDPTDVFGFLKRALEAFEGDQIFNKANGQWRIQDRTSSTTLIVKTITDGPTLITKA